MITPVKARTTSLVPLFAGGTEVDRLTCDVDKTDIRWDNYIDNAELGEFLIWAVSQ